VKLSLYLAGKVLFCPGIATSFSRSGTGKAMEKSNITKSRDQTFIILSSTVANVSHRKTREGSPMVNVENGANGASRSTYERGPSLVGSFGKSCRFKRVWSCLWLLSSTQKKIFFSHHTLFYFFCPNLPASWEGIRAVSVVS
jgi:hypothetical protein